MERDEFLLFPTPQHSLETYVYAHQQSGDLELVDADKPLTLSEFDAAMARLARASKAVRK